MHVRSISQHELDRFVTAGDHALGAAGFTRFIQELWERGSSKPEWCFVVESGDEILGRVVYRGDGEELHFTGLSLPWGGDFLAIGKMLFDESLAALQKQGVIRLEAFISSTTPNAAQIRQLLESIKIPLVQEKVRFTWSGQPAQIEQRLIYRPFSEGDDAAFTDVIRRVSTDSLDRLDVLQRESLGVKEFAQEYFRMLRYEFAFYPHWWLLAYTQANELVGHVVNLPYNLDQHEGTIGYIGVVPEQRGHGYINDILAQSMSVMIQDGIKTIICDTDQLNAPMIAAFKRQGYDYTGTVWVYHTELSDLTGLAD